MCPLLRLNNGRKIILSFHSNIFLFYKRVLEAKNNALSPNYSTQMKFFIILNVNLRCRRKEDVISNYFLKKKLSDIKISFLTSKKKS